MNNEIDYETPLAHCRLCPRACGVNRLAGERGRCGAGVLPRIGRAAPHYWEEPCLSGERGSGTVFFSFCSMGCVFCQNRQLSQEHRGKEVTPEQLAGMFLALQEQGVHNINLVTAAHYATQAASAIRRARERGLTLPVVYNSSGYESPETLALLDGLIEIYLPDFKFFDNRYSMRYANAPDYRETAQSAIAEMVRQAGPPDFGEDGLLKRGVIVRHLMLPGLLFDSKKIVDYLHETYASQIWMSLMNQYTPMGSLPYPELNRTLPPGHYDALVNYALRKGIENAYVQEEGTAKESFIPLFGD